MPQDPISFWNTCYAANGISACASFQAGLVDGSTHPDAPFPWTEPNQFMGGWGNVGPLLINGTDPFRITAWGLQFPTPAELDLFYGDDAANYVNPDALGWTGFSFALQYGEWDFAVGGPHYEAAAWQGYWIDGVVPSLSGTRLAWRGESEDHSRVFDCVQVEAGSPDCIVNFSSVTTTTPEPATILLLLTGFVLVALVRRYARRVVS